MKKKSNNLSLVCFEINLVHIPSNTWWLDSGVIIHVVNFMKGFLTTRNLIGGEKYIEMRNQLKFEVTTIEIYKLVLGISHIFCTYMIIFLLLPKTSFLGLHVILKDMFSILEINFFAFTKISS